MPGKKSARATATRKKTHGTKTAVRSETTGRKASTGRKKSAGGHKKTTGGRKYGKGAGRKVRKAMDEYEHGELKSGRSGKPVKSRKQAIAIGLSEARREGEKVPPNPNER